MGMFEKERQEMVQRLVAFGYGKEPDTIEAMKRVPRHLFVPEDIHSHAYEDRPLPVGEDQTISAPHMVAMMCDLLHLEEGYRVLEIGGGTGYHACVIASMRGDVTVYSMERIKSLAQSARTNLEDAGCRGVEIIEGDGTLGYPDMAPYDRILVTAAAPGIPPPLVEQLKPGGRLIIPVGERYIQELVVVKKDLDGTLEEVGLGGCAFVPLIGKHGW
jgi:protein-L-isoaspartate(D-aspartate) O-methyltransferase